MKIVIIDDEPKIRKGLCKIVEQHEGWHVLQAFATGESALAYLKDVAADVVITDIKMPGMTGLDLIEAMHTACKSTQFIIISGHARFDYAQRAINLGVRKYLMKPTSPEEILEALSQIEAEMPGQNEGKKGSNNLLILRAEEYVQKNYRNKIVLSEVAEALYISPNYLSDLFRKSTGKKFTDYVTEIRLEKSKAYLLDVQYKIGDIAELVGFSDARYFSSVFRKKYNITPLEYRNHNAALT